MNFINNDLDTPAAIANIWKLLDDETVLPEDKIALIYSFDEVLGLGLEHGVTLLEQKRSAVLPTNITKLVQERNSARLARDWKRSDELRTEINKLGYDIKDAANGTEVTKN
jgi:cysteinyl-tRNA synthetase